MLYNRKGNDEKEKIRQLFEDKENSTNKSKTVSKELLQQAQLERQAGHKTTALKIAWEYLNQCRDAYGISDNRTLRAIETVCLILTDLGRKVELLSLVEHELSVCTEAFGEEDQRTLDAMHDVAAALRKNGRDTEANTLIRKGFSIRKNFIQRYTKSLENVNLSILERAAQMANDMYFQAWIELPAEENAADIEEAIAVKRAVVTMLEKAADIEDEHTFDLMDELAECPVHGEPISDMREKILNIRRKVCSAEDMRTVRSMEQLASEIETSMKTAEKARTIREKLLAIQRRQMKEFQQVYGPNDPRTLRTMEKVSEALGALGRLEKAARMREEIYALSRTTFGEAAEETADALEALIETLDKMKQRNEARKCRETLLKLYRIQSDKAMEAGDGAAAFFALQNMIYVLHDMRRPAQEQKVCRELLSILEPHYGMARDNMTWARAWATRRLAMILHRRKRYAEEIPLRKQVISFYREEYGEDSDATVFAMMEALEVMMKQGEIEIEDALAFSREIFAIQSKYLRETHEDAIQSRQNIAFFLALSGKYAESLAIQEESVKLLSEENKGAREDVEGGFALCQMLEIMSRYGLESSELHEKTMALFHKIRIRYLALQPEMPYDKAYVSVPKEILALLGKLEHLLKKAGHKQEAAFLARHREKLRKLERAKSK